MSNKIVKGLVATLLKGSLDQYCPCQANMYHLEGQAASGDSGNRIAMTLQQFDALCKLLSILSDIKGLSIRKNQTDSDCRS